MSGTTEHARHGGAIRQVAAETGLPLSAVCDFSANINPLGPPPWVRRVMATEIDALVHYPEAEADTFRRAVAARWGIHVNEIVAGNGAAELIAWLPRATRATRALIPSPAYVDYAVAAQNAGLDVSLLLLHADNGFALDCVRLCETIRPGDLVFVGRPNNPTGLAPSAASLTEIARLAPEATLVVDEAFIDFCDEAPNWPERPPNLVVLRSLTKFFCIPGLRAGYAVANADLAAELRRCLPPWSMNSLAQAVAIAALRDESDFAARSRAFVAEQRRKLALGLAACPGLRVFDSQANFLLVRCERQGVDAAALGAKLRARGLPVRVCDNYHGLDARYFRVAVRGPTDNALLLGALGELFGDAPKPRGPARRTRALMVQGTSSNAGKSVLVTALCRILLQDGVSVAPFKAQNMSLNSFVTADGGEMGRAQVVQAQACRLPPDTRMNPVLLKPSSDVGSQVIVAGQPVGHMQVGEYIAYKATAFDAVKRAYAALAAEHDVMLLEGAGSPAEVNLKHHDIVNMRMAEHAQAPVLLAGDIDRGGIFAAFVGTMELLDAWERRLVAGFVINRFRGKQALLDDAIRVLHEHTARPCLGVIPYVHDLGLPEEDSVTFKSSAQPPPSTSDQALDIALIDVPHISNFTDGDALRVEPDVRLRVVRSVADLGRPHAIILPGSKSVVQDLRALRDRGLAQAICALANEGCSELIGVCGGLQMLGESIDDPQGVESSAARAPGMGLLPITTTLACRKTLVRSEALHVASGQSLHGYEIHHGETRTRGACCTVRRRDGIDIGFGRADGTVWGTYLHGLFDADGFRHWFLEQLRQRHGLGALGSPRPCYDIEPALDRLAAVVRESIDMKQLYRLLEL